MRFLTGDLVQVLSGRSKKNLDEILREIESNKKDFLEDFNLCIPEVQEFIRKNVPQLF